MTSFVVLSFRHSLRSIPNVLRGRCVDVWVAIEIRYFEVDCEYSFGLFYVLFSDRHTGYPLFETWKHLHRCCWNSRYCGCFIRKHSHHHSFTFLSHHYLLVFITDIDRDESLEQSNRRWRSRTSCECFKIDYGNLHSFYNWIRFFKSFVHRNSSLWTYEKIELDLLVYYIWQMP